MEAYITDSTLAQNLNKAKGIIDQFIRSCSHDLKSPLTSIEGLVQVAEHCTSPDEIGQCLDMIQHCATQMQDMIEKLEDYTSNLQRELVEEEIEADQLIDRVLDEYQEEIDLARISVSTRVSQPVKWIGDEQIYYLILKNLVSNAIHFSDPGKKLKQVNVKVGVNVNDVALEISDNGIGILDREIEKIFDPFHRSAPQAKGSGLGLFLVKGLVEKLQASISVCSQEQVGTTVRVSSPNF